VTTPPADFVARERIERDLEVNLCVEAGAGTGKTTVLVRRVVALLLTGTATVDDLAVITFTEKAAGELSARVRFELEGAADDPALDAERRERAERALRELYRARVQTIHAFAGDILRERPVEARLDPQFETMDELAADVHLEEAYRRWLDGELSERNEPVERAMRRGFELRLLRDLVEAVHRHREVLPLRDVAWTAPDVGALRARAREWEAELATLAGDCHETEDDAYVNLESVRRFCAAVEAAPNESAVERLVLFEAPKFTPSAGQKGRWSGEACAQVKGVLGEFCERTATLAAELRTDALIGLLPLAAGFATKYAELRRSEGLADFDDLLIWARDLLRDDRHVRAHFHRRTPRVLIDEFQDTDPVQAELVTWLCAPPETAGRWSELEPESGSLFVVGDPKQSIYRFRGADIAVYDTVKNGPVGGELENLSENFRSSSELLDWLGGLFDRVLVGEEGVQAANTPLHGQVSMAAELARPPAVVVHSLAEADSASARRDEEFGLLARTITRAVREERWPVRDRTAGYAVRPAQWLDVAILVPSRTEIERLESALQRYGVPYRFESGRGFFARQEVRDLVALLHAIDDPTDAISLVATLRSLAFGCSDEDLLGWQLAHERFDYRPVRADWPGPAPVREALLALRELHGAARGLSLAELVRVAVDRTGLIEAAASLPSGPQSAANVMKLLDHARKFSAAGNGALRAFTGWLARMRDREADEIDAPIAEERDDTVRVMTIHAAKGLEFPIVCLANLESAGNPDTPPVRDVDNGRLHLKVGGGASVFCTPGWEEAKKRERDALRAERDRLLYVACTRARDHLVIPVAAKDTKGSFMQSLKPSLPEWAEERAGGEVDGCWLYDVRELEKVEPVAGFDDLAVAEDVVAGATEARSSWVAARAELVRESARGVEVVTASSVKVDPRPLAAEVESADAEQGSTIDVESTPPLELGDAFHRVMERVTLPGAGDLEELTEAICEEAGIPQAVDGIVAMARACLESELVQRARAAGDVHREVPFVVEQDGKVLVGRIDLLFRDGDDVVVVDYKTDTVSSGGEAAAAEAHRGQTEIYGQAVSEVLGVEGRVEVLFARTGVAVGVSQPR